MATKEPTVNHPIFGLYDVGAIATATGYTEWTLLDIRDRGRKATRKFRLACIHAFGRSEAELFGPVATGEEG